MSLAYVVAAVVVIAVVVVVVIAPVAVAVAYLTKTFQKKQLSRFFTRIINVLNIQRMLIFFKGSFSAPTNPRTRLNSFLITDKEARGRKCDEIRYS